MVALWVVTIFGRVEMSSVVEMVSVSSSFFNCEGRLRGNGRAWLSSGEVGWERGHKLLNEEVIVRLSSEYFLLNRPLLLLLPL